MFIVYTMLLLLLTISFRFNNIQYKKVNAIDNYYLQVTRKIFKMHKIIVMHS